MEKRLMAAFLLSFLFLYAWSSMNPKPSSKPSLNEQPRTYQNDMDKAISSSENNPAAAAASLIDEPPSVAANQKTYVIQNEKLKIEISNLGGKITKLVLNEYNESLPITDVLAVEAFEDAEFTLVSDSSNRIILSSNINDVVIEKEMALVGEGYQIESSLKMTGNDLMSKMGNIEIGAFILDISRLDKKTDIAREKGLFEYSALMSNDVFRKSNATKFSSKEAMAKNADIKWVGFRNRYFCFIVDPEYPVNKYRINPQNDQRIQFFIKPNLEKQVSLNSFKLRNSIFCGPQKYDLLEKYGKEYEQIMVFSKYKLLDAVAKLIYITMIGIHKIIPNWGATILILSFFIYLLMYPLTLMGLTSMKKMQTLQPRMNQLREQYKNNPQRLNKEIMELYKEHRVNPMSGCLPMIFQMPVFIGLYQVLWRSVVFKGASFLWIKDLAEPDRLFIFPVVLPVIGNELNILPILMMIIMFFQQKFTAKNTVIADPAQASQQKMMMMFLPVFLGFIFYKFASGLCLYFTVFYLFSTFTQWNVSRKTTAA